jgi:hypothetical protein
MSARGTGKTRPLHAKRGIWIAPGERAQIVWRSNQVAQDLGRIQDETMKLSKHYASGARRIRRVIESHPSLPKA